MHAKNLLFKKDKMGLCINYADFDFGKRECAMFGCVEKSVL